MGRAGISSSVSSSVELHSENALCIGGRIGGMAMILGGSVVRSRDLVGDRRDAPPVHEKSGHEFGERGS